MDQVHVLRHKVFKEGQSIRRVARELEVSRNTVSEVSGAAGAGQEYYDIGGAAGVGSGAAAARGVDGGVGAANHRQAAPDRRCGCIGSWCGRLSRRPDAGGRLWRERRRQRAEVYVPLINRPGEAQIDSSK